MKTFEIPDDVREATSRRLLDQTRALGLAADVLTAWDSAETVYEAGKASWTPDMKLRVRRMALSTLDTLARAKGTFIDSEQWLDSWVKAGQKRMAEFARLGLAPEPFVPSPGSDLGPAMMPGAQKAVAIIDQAIDHLGELVWDGELYQLFTQSKEE